MSDDDASLAVRMRARRNALLAWTDWTQLPDVNHVRRDEYAAYRKALRDLPALPGFPNVEFPASPTS